ncbi:cactin, spliceosome C complex subunit [Oratosquilla oratoria]|uniref:cactin, spliceosome C complex subunit n=1 Tax=Oratosquilla oratoria TaxID=337810 RepID=UPI003F763A0E
MGSDNKKKKSRDYEKYKNKNEIRVKDRHADRPLSRSRSRSRDRKYKHRSRSYSPCQQYEIKRRISRSKSREKERKQRSPARERSESYESQVTREHERRRNSRSRSTELHQHRNRSRSPSDSSSSRKKKKKPKKKNKKKKRGASSASSSSESSELDEEISLLERLEKERQRHIKEAIMRKEAGKANETPEEKRLRRLQKKEAKERGRKEKMGWDSDYLHFTNADNPYGDNNLLETFVWRRKLEKEGLSDISKEEIEKRNRAKMEENKRELEKVKKRRQERELERAEREKAMELEQRQREAAQFSQFSKQEDQFQLEQARLRSYIRIQDSRAKPIDLLAQYVSSEGDVSAVDMHEPYTHLTGLTLRDLEDLLEDIKVYMQLEKENENQAYWTDLTVIVQDEVRRLRQRDLPPDATAHRQGIHMAVASDVSSIFKNKSVAELSKLQLNIENKLAGPTAGLDVGYWESLLSQLKAHQARARLRERHRDNLRKKLELLKAEQGVKEEREEDEDVKPPVPEEGAEEQTSEKDNESSDKEDTDSWDSGCEGDAIIDAAITAYDSGRYSPTRLQQDSLEPGTVVVDEAEDAQRLVWARGRVVGAGQAVESVMTAEEKAMQQEARRAMTNDEAQFSVEAKLENSQYLWSDKYRPRKPRYFNRVHTGFEWNKYNQTHYDMDNPPPKIVQGYKFNIFYPDLMDKGKTPQYELIPCEGNKDFALLKFTAGPPYEDIAFKIVNREWEYSYKRGFRCQFHNNIFQLWFHFKRYRYRR